MLWIGRNDASYVLEAMVLFDMSFCTLTGIENLSI